MNSGISKYLLTRVLVVGGRLIMDTLTHKYWPNKFIANYLQIISLHELLLTRLNGQTNICSSQKHLNFCSGGTSGSSIRKFSQMKSDAILHNFRRLRLHLTDAACPGAAPRPPVSGPGCPAACGCRERCRGPGPWAGGAAQATAPCRIITGPPGILWCRLRLHMTVAAARDLTCQRTTQH